MKNFFKNYNSALLLLLSIIIGAVIGLIFGEDATVLEPFGTLYLNLLFVIIVPLIFFGISSGIANMSNPNRFSKIIRNTLIIFVIMSLVAAFVGLIGTYVIKPFNSYDATTIKDLMSATSEDTTINVLDKIVNTFTVSDFSLLLSRSNILALIVFSILVGFGTYLAKEQNVKNLLKSGSHIIEKIVEIILYYAPIGICCYFATLVGTLGAQILEGYLKTFVLYVIISAIMYFGIYTLYAYIAAGKNGIKAYWKNLVSPSVTALSTCSSAASMPVNVDSCKRIGVHDDIAETSIALGTALHKDGSIIGGVFKIVFLFTLFDKNLYSIGNIFSIVGVALLVGAVMVALPGVSMVAEMLILSIFGFPQEALPIILVISAIIDAPATLLNVVGDTSASMLISRTVEGKDWLEEKQV